MNISEKVLLKLLITHTGSVTRCQTWKYYYNCSKSPAAQLSGFPHEYTSMRKNIDKSDNETSQRCRFPVPDQKTFGNLLGCPFISAFWTLLREKPTKSLILYQFLRQGLRKDAKSDRNWCIWCQLLCDPTGMKHHNIHKTTKIHVFFTKNPLKT